MVCYVEALAFLMGLLCPGACLRIVMNVLAFAGSLARMRGLRSLDAGMECYASDLREDGS